MRAAVTVATLMPSPTNRMMFLALPVIRLDGELRLELRLGGLEIGVVGLRQVLGERAVVMATIEPPASRCAKYESSSGSLA